MAKLTRRKIMGAAVAGLSTAYTLPARAELTTKHGFNDGAIDWMLLDEGIKQATLQKKPILLLAHTTWCPHCVKYKKLFFDEKVVAAIEPYVCCLIDRDEQPELSDAYSPDGDYVPRTMVLNSDGVHAGNVQGPYTEYNYFLPNDDSETLIAFLEKGNRVFQDQDFQPAKRKSVLMRLLEKLQKSKASSAE